MVVLNSTPLADFLEPALVSLTNGDLRRDLSFRLQKISRPDLFVEPPHFLLNQDLDPSQRRRFVRPDKRQIRDH